MIGLRKHGFLGNGIYKHMLHDFICNIIVTVLSVASRHVTVTYVLILCHAMNVFCVAQAVNTALSFFVMLSCILYKCLYTVCDCLSAQCSCPGTRDRCMHAPSQRSRAVDHRPTITL